MLTVCMLVLQRYKIFFSVAFVVLCKITSRRGKKGVFYLAACMIFFTSRVAMASLCSSLLAQKIYTALCR